MLGNRDTSHVVTTEREPSPAYLRRHCRHSGSYAGAIDKQLRMDGQVSTPPTRALVHTTRPRARDANHSRPNGAVRVFSTHTLPEYLLPLASLLKVVVHSAGQALT